MIHARYRTEITKEDIRRTRDSQYRYLENSDFWERTIRIPLKIN
jgi:hypothetical protein